MWPCTCIYTSVNNYYLNLKDDTILIKLFHASQQSIDHKGLLMENILNLENHTIQNWFKLLQKTES